MGNAVRRFMNSTSDNEVFEFVVDTNNIDPLATDGAENPLTLKLDLQFPTNVDHQFIIRVNDGRPDVLFNRTEAGTVIHFDAPGIYTITLIGKSSFFRGPGLDRLKWIYLNRWGSSFKGLRAYAFQDASNLIIRSPESIKLTGSRSGFFQGIKGFEAPFDMGKLDVSDVTSFTSFFSVVQNPFTSVLNPFINVATNLNSLYEDVNLSFVDKIEVISPSATQFGKFLMNTEFEGELIINAPVENMYYFLNGVSNPPSLGKVDIRRVSETNNFISTQMSKHNVDSTLMGWANNFDWTGYTPSSTFNFRGSKYSNNPDVIAAKSFLEGKGIVFTNLTME